MKTIKSEGRGGKRAGSGRKLGAATKKTREIADRAAQEGETPLEYMLRIMRDEDADLAMRFDAAKSAAPYIHPRLATVDAKVKGDMGLTVEIVRFGAA